ncbi:MAG: hypothetical protein ABSD20_06255 [Terriglobales bacterium]|jgi:hypothetical protein
MASATKSVVGEAHWEVPRNYKAQWLKELFAFSDTEMAHVLGVSVETLRKWLREEEDRHALESVRFHRLLNLTQLAKGVIRPDRFGHWIHCDNEALAGIVPLNLLADAHGYEIVAGVVEDIRSGTPA